MSEQKQATLDNEVTMHHLGDERVDRLRILLCVQYPTQSGNCHLYAVVDARDESTVHMIDFQKGPVCEAGLNGVTMEALLAIVAHRLQGFQKGEMACRENALALTKIEEALHWLQTRTRRRLAAGEQGRGKP